MPSTTGAPYASVAAGPLGSVVEPYMSVVATPEGMLETSVEARLETRVETAGTDDTYPLFVTPAPAAGKGLVSWTAALSEITLPGVSRLYHGVAVVRAGRRAKRIGIE